MAPPLLPSRLSIAATARKLDVHVSTVWRWIYRGVGGRRLASIKVGGRRFIREEDLARFLRAGGPEPGKACSTLASPAAVSAGRTLDKLLR